MYFANSNFFKYLAITVLAFSLSSCGTLQSIYEEAPSLFQTPKKSEIDPLQKELRALDLANDREAARNAYIQNLIVASDQLCEKHKRKIIADSQLWDVKSEKENRQFDEQLKEAISLRRSDLVRPNVTVLSRNEMETAEYSLAKTIVESIETTRKMTGIQLKARMEDPLRQYSLKQGLLDVQAYQNSCSVTFAAGTLARKSVEKMTPDERSASIESLMKLRQKLMDEGLNARAVQQKIDALILDQ